MLPPTTHLNLPPQGRPEHCRDTDAPRCPHTQGQGLPQWPRGESQALGGKRWRRTAGQGGTRGKDRSQGARWAWREQKLSGKRRINSRHQATSQAYAPQAGATSTQWAGEVWPHSRGTVDSPRLTVAWPEPGVESPSVEPQNHGAACAGRVGRNARPPAPGMVSGARTEPQTWTSEYSGAEIGRAHV